MNTTRILSGICPILLLLYAPSSWGFEKQAHIEISKRAVAIYRELNPSASERIDHWGARFATGSSDEDNISFQRLWNWHFYDPGSRLARAWWGARRSNTSRFDDLAGTLAHGAFDGSPDSYALAGRLAHHIQDMSSPPHTVPIYHTTKDPFDKYATDTIVRVNLSAAQIEAVKIERRAFRFESLRELLTDAAQRTIGRVESPVDFNGQEIANNWTGFWRKYELTGAECGEAPSRGFGCYGTQTFGVDSGPFTPGVYGMFYEQQIASAIEDTLRLLMLLENGAH